MASAAEQIVAGPAWVIGYKGVNVTKNISQMVTRISYTSYIAGASGGLELDVEDSQKVWQSNWGYPRHGDQISLQIGFSGSKLMACPDFTIDEIEFVGSPDVIKIRCLAAFITDSMRTPNTTEFVNQTLLDIAVKIASKYGFGVRGVAAPLNPPLDYVKQKQETDLAFLGRLAEEHNYNFTVRNNEFIFTSRTSYEVEPSSGTITRQNLTKWSLKSRSQYTYKAATLTYFNPLTKENITVTVNADPVPTGATDILKIMGERCSDSVVAQTKATAILHKNNMLVVTGTLEGPGDTIYAGGNNFQLSGFGIFDGLYELTESNHILTRKGYTVSLKIRNLLFR